MQLKSRLKIGAIAALFIGGIVLVIVFLWMQKPVTLSGLAYDAHPRYGYTIYLEEEGSFEPYYVLTDRYNGQGGTTLLLRKYLLNDKRMYHPYTVEGSYSAYYENSSIDQFLNSAFYETLSPIIQDNLLNTNITIADKKALSDTNRLTFKIKRKVFLLAIAEIRKYEEYSLMTNEGDSLKFFSTQKGNPYIALHENGQADSWWTRSASIWGTTDVLIISLDGLCGAAQTGYMLGVRPAFCLPGDLPVELRTGIKDGESVYVIDWPERQIAQ